MNIKSYSMLPTKELLPNREHNGSTAEHSSESLKHCTAEHGSKLLEKHLETEGLLKLNPYPILDTDPPSNSSKFTKTHVSLRSISKPLEHSERFVYLKVLKKK